MGTPARLEQLRANLLAKEEDVGEGEEDHSHGHKRHDLRPDQKNALVKRQEPWDLLLG